LIEILKLVITASSEWIFKEEKLWYRMLKEVLLEKSQSECDSRIFDWD
jgi:hypothetical protein